MLGANVGSALVSYALSFDITLVYPLLILVGLVSFRSSTRTLTRNLGRAVIGLGLMLLALHLLVDTAVPGATAPQAGELLAALTREPLLVLVASARARVGDAFEHCRRSGHRRPGQCRPGGPESPPWR